MNPSNWAVTAFVCLVIAWVSTEPYTLKVLSTVGRHRSELVTQSSWIRSVLGTIIAISVYLNLYHWFILETGLVFLAVITMLPFVIFRLNRRAYGAWVRGAESTEALVENGDALRRTGAAGENIVWPVIVQEEGRPKKRPFQAETRSELGQYLKDWNHQGASQGKDWIVRDFAGRPLDGEVVKGRVIFLVLATAARRNHSQPPPS